MIKVLFLLFLVIILLFTILKKHENFDGTCSVYTTEEECPEIKCVYQENQCLEDRLDKIINTNPVLESTSETSNKIVCETIDDKNDCINYGCNYKTFDLECVTQGKDIDNCPMITFDKNKISDNIDVYVHNNDNDNNNDIVVDDIVYNPKYIKTIKPGITYDKYLENISNVENFYLFTNNLTNVNNLDLKRIYIDIDTLISLRDNDSVDIVKDNMIHILFVYEIDNNIYVKYDLENIDNLRKLNGQKLYQLNSFKNCYKNGGNEEIGENGNVVCKKNNEILDNNSKIIKKCVNPNNNGCLHFNTKDACEDNNYDDSLKRNRCRWIKENNYCYDNIYDSNSNSSSDSDDHTCLRIRDRYTCNTTPNCKYRINLDKCVNSKLCSDFIDEDSCNKDELCYYDEIDGKNKCLKKPTIRNLYDFNSNHSNINNKITELKNEISLQSYDNLLKISADADLMLLDKYVKEYKKLN